MLEYLSMSIVRVMEGSDLTSIAPLTQVEEEEVDVVPIQSVKKQRNTRRNPMASSASGQAAILKHTKITLNRTFTTAPVMPSLNENLLQRDVYDYDFNRERIFLEIANAEIAAMRKAEEKAAAASENDDSDDELARQSAKLSLSSSMGSTGHQDGAVTKPRSTSEEDVAAAISASLREY